MMKFDVDGRLSLQERQAFIRELEPASAQVLARKWSTQLLEEATSLHWRWSLRVTDHDQTTHVVWVHLHPHGLLEMDSPQFAQHVRRLMGDMEQLSLERLS